MDLVSVGFSKPAGAARRLHDLAGGCGHRPHSCGTRTAEGMLTALS